MRMFFGMTSSRRGCWSFIRRQRLRCAGARRARAGVMPIHRRRQHVVGLGNTSVVRGGVRGQRRTISGRNMKGGEAGFGAQRLLLLLVAVSVPPSENRIRRHNSQNKNVKIKISW
jgi:hypothetical protein